MGKNHKKSKKKWTPPMEWPKIEVDPNEVFLPKYKNLDFNAFRRTRTTDARQVFYALNVCGVKCPSDIAQCLHNSVERYYSELNKLPGFDIDYTKLNYIDFRMHNTTSAEVDNLAKFTDGDNTKDTSEKLLRNMYPIFTEGVLYGQFTSHVIYFKIIDMNEDMIKVHLRKLGFVDDKFMNEATEEVYRKSTNFNIYTVEYEADFCISVCKTNGQWGVKCTYSNETTQGTILQIVSPKTVKFDRFQYEIWKRVILKVCVEEDVFVNPVLRAKYGFMKDISTRYYELGKTFMLYMGLVNYYIWLRKQNMKSNSRKKPSGNNPTDYDKEIPDGEQKILVLGNSADIRIRCSDENSLDLDAKRIYTYHKQAWERREFYRRCKSGKVVKVRSTICRRKGVPEDVEVPKVQNIVKVI